MTWYAVYSKSDGTLLSTGEVLPDTLPDDRTSVEISEPQQLNQVWDKATHQFVLAATNYTQTYTDVFGAVKTLVKSTPITNQDVFNAQMPNFSKLQFRKLFTLAELFVLDGVEYSAASDQIKQTMRTINKNFDAAQYISVVDPLTIQGVNSFEQLGLIAVGRAAQILAGQIPS
jgi:hypothetical protein